MDSAANGAAAFGGLFYEEGSFGVFLLVTIVLGGGAALLAGRAVALTWRPWWQAVWYSLMSLHYYVIDTAFCMAFAAFGFRAARAVQMIRQYRWINEPNGLLRWRRKAP
jgi:hypothetical protein